METTAEGVETIDQLDILREQGCNQIQGNFFSKPLPAGEVGAMLGLDQRGASPRPASVVDFTDENAPVGNRIEPIIIARP